jgi:hypothetical protein
VFRRDPGHPHGDPPENLSPRARWRVATDDFRARPVPGADLRDTDLSEDTSTWDAGTLHGR